MYLLVHYIMKKEQKLVPNPAITYATNIYNYSFFDDSIAYDYNGIIVKLI